MPYFKLKNIQDVIVTLREIACFLESVEVSPARAASTSKQMPKKPAKQERAPVDIIALSASIRSLPRQELIETLSGLSTTTLRSLCYQIGLRGMGKRKKDEVIQAIVRELIDFAEEHRRLSTFSRRKIEEAGSTKPNNAT